MEKIWYGVKKAQRCRLPMMTKGQRAELADRIMANIRHKESDYGDCWLWKGYRNELGYGRVSVLGKMWYVHRVTWLLRHGECPPGKVLRHKCGIQRCCNPAHIEPATFEANNSDKPTDEPWEY